MKCLDEGKIESDIMTWQTSLDLMETLDRIRIDAGIFFPEHDKNLVLLNLKLKIVNENRA
jgi:hypothetical protein